MKVDTQAAKFKTQHGSAAYYFCSAGCKAAFEKDPHKYLGAHAH
jgi:Cu+-exporting ATPase